jgi:hypothetical protein
MQLRGHPLIDAGLATAAIIAGKGSIEDVTSGDLGNAVKRLLQDMGGLQGLKVLSIYWHNNPFMGLNKGQKQKYQQHLESLIIEHPPSRAGYCQLCGASPVYKEANRSWFPLVGSPDSDPSTLPGLGGKAVCADCFRAIVLLPLSCRLCKGGAYLFHVGDPQLQVEATAEAFRKINAQLITAKSDRVLAKSNTLRTETTLSGRLELLEIVSRSVLWNHVHPEHLSRIPPDGATIISFRNGDPPSVYQLHLPVQALEFLSALIERHRDEIFLKWAKDSKFFFFDRICDDIETRRSLAPIVAALVKKRPEKNRGLTKEELEVLHIYEDVALRKKERFDALERIASEINEMKPVHRDSFIKRLAGMRSKDSFWQLLTEFKRRANLKISASDLRLIGESFETETISLLYLLCTAEQ